LLLASESPRRAELLTQLGLTYTIHRPQVEEPPAAPGEDLRVWAEQTALRKARAVATAVDGIVPTLILAADTVVVVPTIETPALPLLDGLPVTVLGKPRDVHDARRMLQLLSGRTHTVLTALALLSLPEYELTLSSVATQVQFRALYEQEIDDYLASGEALDKAGAYGIQGQGAVLVAGIVGDYYTVVGLPLARLWESLSRWR